MVGGGEIVEKILRNMETIPKVLTTLVRTEEEYRSRYQARQ